MKIEEINYRSNRRLWVIGAYMLIFFVAGFCPAASAQESEYESIPDGSSDTASENSVNMSGSEMLRWVNERFEGARAAVSSVHKLTQQAGEEKDTIKITCLDDKLMQMSLSMGGVEERIEALRAAVSSGELNSARQNFEILKIYFTRIVGLSGEAENCLGESDVVLGKTETTMLISGDITVEDPSGEDIVENVGVEQPPQISGYY